MHVYRGSASCRFAGDQWWRSLRNRGVCRQSRSRTATHSALRLSISSPTPSAARPLSACSLPRSCIPRLSASALPPSRSLPHLAIRDEPARTGRAERLAVLADRERRPPPQRAAQHQSAGQHCDGVCPLSLSPSSLTRSSPRASPASSPASSASPTSPALRCTSPPRCSRACPPPPSSAPWTWGASSPTRMPARARWARRASARGAGGWASQASAERTCWGSCCSGLAGMRLCTVSWRAAPLAPLTAVYD